MKLIWARYPVHDVRIPDIIFPSRRFASFLARSLSLSLSLFIRGLFAHFPLFSWHGGLVAVKVTSDVGNIETASANLALLCTRTAARSNRSGNETNCPIKNYLEHTPLVIAGKKAEASRKSVSSVCIPERSGVPWHSLTKHWDLLLRDNRSHQKHRNNQRVNSFPFVSRCQCFEYRKSNTAVGMYRWIYTRW